MALAGPFFEIRESVDADGAARVSLIGELDIAVADGVEERLRALREEGRPVRLDLSALDFIDSSGVRTLVLGLKHSRESGHDLQVDRKISGPVQRMVQIMGIGGQLWPDDRPAS